MAAPKQMRPLLHTALPHCLIYLSRVWSTRVPNVDLLSWVWNSETHHPRYLLGSFFCFYRRQSEVLEQRRAVRCFNSLMQLHICHSARFTKIISIFSLISICFSSSEKKSKTNWCIFIEWVIAKGNGSNSRRWMMQTRTLSNFTFCVHAVITLRYTQISSFLHLRIFKRNYSIIRIVLYFIILPDRKMWVENVLPPKLRASN